MFKFFNDFSVSNQPPVPSQPGKDPHVTELEKLFKDDLFTEIWVIYLPGYGFIVGPAEDPYLP